MTLGFYSTIGAALLLGFIVLADGLLCASFTGCGGLVLRSDADLVECPGGLCTVSVCCVAAVAPGLTKPSMFRFQVFARVLSDATPISPIAWALFHGENPIWQSGQPATTPFTSFAEDGASSDLLAYLESRVNGDRAVSDVGVAFANPTHPSPTLIVNQTARFAFAAADGDQFTFATMFMRSNDRFLAPDTAAGIPLFLNGQPIWNITGWNTTVNVSLWDAGTERNQPYWANLHLGQQSTQPGGGRSAVKDDTRENGVISKVPDADFSGPIPYPRPETILEVKIVKGFNVVATPNVRAYKGATMTFEYTFDSIEGLGNEIRVTFPSGFGFNQGSTTQATLGYGFAQGTQTPTVALLTDGKTIAIRWTPGANISLSDTLVSFALSGIGLPDNCDVQTYTIATHYCVDENYFNQTIQTIHKCSPPLTSDTSLAPDGVPKGCTVCNACQFSYVHPFTNQALFQCEENGIKFTRRASSVSAFAAAGCDVNPYNVGSYGSS